MTQSKETKPAADAGPVLSEGLGISNSHEAAPLVLQDTSEVLARINSDGTTYYDWPRIQAMAAKWQPYCKDFGINLAKLLAPLQPRHF